ncbi:MAG TPA: hypothetical protein PLV31_04450 [Gammaproteobacteria bacterium]|nr:hypothetical protein [Gammaproteobacteria bacterium]HRA42920.1 hypothetical protein [Gammaproteobacteria bacterium]
MSPKWSDLWKELTEKFQSIETAKNDLLHSNDLPHPAEENAPPKNKTLTLQLDREKADNFSQQILQLSKEPKGGPSSKPND